MIKFVENEKKFHFIKFVCQIGLIVNYSQHNQNPFKAFNCVKLGQNHMEEFQPISQVKNMRSGINTKGVVKSMGDPRTVNLKSGGTIDVCDAILTDGETENDEIKLTLWGDDIKAVNVGDTIVITNGYTNSFRDEVSLTKGKYGKMEVNPL